MVSLVSPVAVWIINSQQQHQKVKKKRKNRNWKYSSQEVVAEIQKIVDEKTILPWCTRARALNDISHRSNRIVCHLCVLISARTFILCKCFFFFSCFCRFFFSFSMASKSNFTRRWHKMFLKIIVNRILSTHKMHFFPFRCRQLFSSVRLLCTLINAINNSSLSRRDGTFFECAFDFDVFFFAVPSAKMVLLIGPWWHIRANRNRL